MTTSTSLSGSKLATKPPAKGSFPLDHLSECKPFAIAYETCLAQNENLTSRCRKEARLYLQCRMERGLMAQEEWVKLGLGDENLKVNATKEEANRAESQGFVAGAREAKRRKERYGERGQG